jgi:CBS domain-containing protein
VRVVLIALFAMLALSGSARGSGSIRCFVLLPAQGRLAVVDNNKLVGVVTRHDILHFIEIHTELEG